MCKVSFNFYACQKYFNFATHNFSLYMNQHSNTALIVINYGTPDTASRRDVARYLRQLLDDKHVMTMNAVGRKILVNCIIAPLRSKKSSKLYQKLAAVSGGEMPLKTHSKNFADKLQTLLGDKADVFVAMSAGYALVEDVMDEVLAANYQKIVIAPMFPQYTESTWGKILDDVFSSLKGQFNVPPVSVIEPFYQDELFLDAMCGVINDNIPQMSDIEKFVFSYHGVPILHTQMAHPGKSCGELGCVDAVGGENSRCYLAQCHHQTRLLAAKLGISPERCLTTFQSRFSDNWVSPYTDAEVRRLASDGIRNIAVITPSFTVDCLETIVEIGETLRDTFLECGGKRFVSVPCLNASDLWTENFCKILEKSL